MKKSSKILLFFYFSLVFLLLCSCNRDERYCGVELPTEADVPETTQFVENPYRSQYLIDSIVWFETSDNHKTTQYIYDEDNKLVQRIITGQIREYGGVRDFRYETQFEYEDGLVSRIIEDGREAMRIYYDNNQHIIRIDKNGRSYHYYYLNGKVISIYEDGSNPFESGYLVYDASGNAIKYVSFSPELNMMGEPIEGTCESFEHLYMYDHGTKPYFGLDYLFVYQPISGLGTEICASARELSNNNLVSYGNTTWIFSYNELGLPVSIRERWGGTQPTYDPKDTIYYRKIE